MNGPTRNPVAKNLRKFNRVWVQSNRKTCKRRPKHQKGVNK